MVICLKERRVLYVLKNWVKMLTETLQKCAKSQVESLETLLKNLNFSTVFFWYYCTELHGLNVFLKNSGQNDTFSPSNVRRNSVINNK